MSLDNQMNKGKKLVDYIWLKSFFQYIKNSPDKKIVTLDNISEYVFVNYFILIRANNVRLQLTDFLYNRIDEMVQISKLRIIIDTNKLSNKELLARILKFP